MDIVDETKSIKKRTALLLIIAVSATALWFFTEVYVASRWIQPEYNFALNAISDLGATDRHVSQFLLMPDREIFSPAYRFFNSMMIGQGVLYIVIVGFLVQQNRPGVLTILVGVGLIVVALIPSSASNIDSGLTYAHQLGSLFPLIGGPFNSYLIAKRMGFPAGKVIGCAGTICGLLVPFTYKLGVSAIPQRAAVYSIFLWACVFAVSSYLQSRKSNT